MHKIKILNLRLAELHDKKNIFNWRNSEQTRKYSFDNKLISWETHSAWFDNALASDDIIILIGEMSHQPVGVLKYEISNDSVEVSIYLVPGLSGWGLGTELLLIGNEWVKKNLPKIKTIKARILAANKPSVKVFTKAGFKPIRGEYIYDV